eukprot:GCRY01009699.1.p2 GENE.GCRY01009699.1~~GCRY01009699.1.p2  ORF type:complete len:106 (-),score=7.16 GCRY01009699.1:76-393(-)
MGGAEPGRRGEKQLAGVPAHGQCQNGCVRVDEEGGVEGQGGEVLEEEKSSMGGKVLAVVLAPSSQPYPKPSPRWVGLKRMRAKMEVEWGRSAEGTRAMSSGEPCD